MAILVTGGAGFIGSNLIKSLLVKTNEKIICVDSMILGKLSNIDIFVTNQKLKNKFHFHNINICNKKKLEKIFKLYNISKIFHLAANSDISKSMSDYNIDLKNTFLTTVNLLNFAKKYRIKFFFFASSSAIYGDLDLKLNENTGSLSPISLYGSAKLASEAYIATYANSFGLKSLIFRFPNVVGPNLTHGVIYDFIMKLRNNNKVLQVLGDGNQKKPYLHVVDLINAIFLTIKNFPADKNIEIYNVSGVGSTTVKSIAKYVVNKYGTLNTKIRYQDNKFGWLGDIQKFQYDTKKIKQIGWKPLYSSNEAVKKSIEENQ